MYVSKIANTTLQTSFPRYNTDHEILKPEMHA